MRRSRATRRLASTLAAAIILALVWWLSDAPPDAAPDAAPQASPVAREDAGSPAPSARTSSANNASSAEVETETTTEDDSSGWSGLTEVRPNVFVSPAGLEYGEGSAEGHRLSHLMRHAEDSPGRPIHGVFEGSREEILALLDEVWQTAQSRGPPDVEREVQGGRTVYTVNVGRKIGYVGGRSGSRRGFPPCRAVKLVLEGTAVITAYPVDAR